MTFSISSGSAPIVPADILANRAIAATGGAYSYSTSITATKYNVIRIVLGSTASTPAAGVAITIAGVACTVVGGSALPHRWTTVDIALDATGAGNAFVITMTSAGLGTQPQQNIIEVFPVDFAATPTIVISGTGDQTMGYTIYGLNNS